MNFASVDTKKDFVRRYSQGEFGNHSPTWDSLDDMEESDDGLGWIRTEGQLFHIRNRIKGGDTWYDVKGEDLADCWYSACALVGKENLYISAMAPTEKTVIQGELMQSSEGLYLFYTHVRMPMREALKKHPEEASGLKLLFLLRLYLCPNSYDWIQILLERYPNHVIEFSTYSTNFGTLPGYNTCFWEVRNY